MLYRLSWVVLKALLSIMWPIEVSGLDNIPTTGGGLVCSNHFSNWDPLVLATRVKRQVHFMGKDELYQNAFLRWLLNSWGMIRVKRGLTDRRAMREVLQYLQGGEMCGIFPEGKRYGDGELHAFYQGATYFAIKAGVPLIPTAIIGDYRKLRSRITVRFGTPLHPPQNDSPERSEMEQWTKILMQEVAELQEVNYDAKYQPSK